MEAMVEKIMEKTAVNFAEKAVEKFFESGTFGKVGLMGSVAIDFSEMIRADEWHLRLVNIMNENKFIKEGHDFYRFQNTALYLKFFPEYFPIFLGDEENEEDAELKNLDENLVLCVGRLRIYGYPRELKKDALGLLFKAFEIIADGYRRWSSKEFFALEIQLESEKKAIEFRDAIRRELKNKPRTEIKIENQKVIIIGTLRSEVLEIFRIVEKILTQNAIIKKFKELPRRILGA
ncbi:MAG: hypothetical protein QXZ17_14685 [Nitrososphaerota archaeon]